MVPNWLEFIVPTTLTLKNIPDDLYQRLKASAQANRRSLNGEALVCLETALQAPRAIADQVARIRALRETLAPEGFTPQTTDQLKREGRG